jgi:radical SAM superfamily enzyme YgiQ (UPF0313 family)
MQKKDLKILLIIPSYRKIIYENTKIKVGRIDSPILSMAVIAAGLLKNGHTVKILDLNLFDNVQEIILNEISSYCPEFVGITVVTPLFNEMVNICKLIKKYNPDIKIVIGGPHVSSLPEESLLNSEADIAVIGEGDFTIIDIVNNKNLKDIEGIAYKSDGEIKVNVRREQITNLDILPFPTWQLYDLNKYHTSKLMSRKSPAGWIETSRGCPFNCCYCNKSVFGRRFRAKSSERVLDEMQYMLDIGFREIHIADDMFTTDVNRVKEICDGIIKRKLKFPWATVTGIRVDRGDEEMFKKMAEAGCYRIYLGIESGNQSILNLIGKNITLNQVRKTVNMIKKYGMEICGFFMIALPGETEKTIEDTINFACELNLDFAKLTITTPLPATPLFNDLDKNNRIKTKDWSKYNLYLPTNYIYDHPNLEWEIIQKYYNKFYRRFYFRISYILRTLKNAVLHGNLINYIIYF